MIDEVITVAIVSSWWRCRPVRDEPATVAVVDEQAVKLRNDAYLLAEQPMQALAIQVLEPIALHPLHQRRAD